MNRALLGAMAAMSVPSPAPAYTAVQRTGMAPDQQAMHVTLRKLDDGRWRLWVWTHDSPRATAYTARSVNGPWTAQEIKQPALPAGWNAGHWSSGDVAKYKGWYYSTPHSITTAGDRQATFLIRSRDGVHDWQLAHHGPILDPAGAGAYEDAYARFLRDDAGNLVKRNGKFVIYYRRTRRTSAQDEHYSLVRAESTDLRHWHQTAETAKPGIFSLGSARLYAGQEHLRFAPYRPGLLVDGPYVTRGWQAYGQFNGKDWSVQVERAH